MTRREVDPDDPHAGPAILVEQPEQAKGAITLHERLPDRVCVVPLRCAVPFPSQMMPVLLDTPRARGWA